MSENKIVYTIGYTSFPEECFVDVLKKYGVTALIDVRSSPYSKYYKFFDKENLISVLNQHNIIYQNFNEEFGARQSNIKYYENEKLNFERFIAGVEFHKGIERLNKALKKNFVVCLMCAEKDPITCHRAIMCGQGLKGAGFQVLHIIADKEKNPITESQGELELKLLQLHKLDQMNLFDIEYDEAKKTKEAYQKQNEDIGYKLEEGN